MKKRSIMIIFCCLLSSGCVARTYWYGKVGLPSKAADYPIDVLLPGETIGHPYQVLGIVQVDGWYGAGSETLIKGALVQARKRGGDAVVLGDLGQKVVSYNTYIPGDPGYLVAAGASSSSSAAVAVATPNAAAAAAASSSSSRGMVAYRAPTPARVIPAQVAWPTLSAIILRYTDANSSGEEKK